MPYILLLFREALHKKSATTARATAPFSMMEVEGGGFLCLEPEELDLRFFFSGEVHCCHEVHDDLAWVSKDLMNLFVDRERRERTCVAFSSFSGFVKRGPILKRSFFQSGTGWERRREQSSNMSHKGSEEKNAYLCHQ